jgi:hypothetical protein
VSHLEHSRILIVAVIGLVTLVTRSICNVFLVKTADSCSVMQLKASERAMMYYLICVDSIEPTLF